MTMLVRTDPATTDHTGLSMLLAAKPRGSEADPFPAPGLTGGELEVLGYRGMKEYELAFDGFRVPAAGLLGGVEGQGFSSSCAPSSPPASRPPPAPSAWRSARWSSPWRYARDRHQFGKPLIAFPRVYSKIAMMAVEIMIARQLTYFAAREKDEGRRCDLEAGMAKLLAARIAWGCADNALQIHGGNGFALEYPISRVLCDARILSIFEGAAEESRPRSSPAAFSSPAAPDSTAPSPWPKYSRRRRPPASPTPAGSPQPPAPAPPAAPPAAAPAPPRHRGRTRSAPALP